MNEKSVVSEFDSPSADQSDTVGDDQSSTVPANPSSTPRGNPSGVLRGNPSSVLRGNPSSALCGDQPSIIEKDIKGTVITNNHAKHFAFIRRKDKVVSHDIFAREASLVAETRPRKFFLSDTCRFDLMRTVRGVEAINIQILERNIRRISQLGKIPKKKESSQPTNLVSGDLFQSTIAELFKAVLNKPNDNRRYPSLHHQHQRHQR